MKNAEIVNLSVWRNARCHPVLMQVEAYWDGLRNGRDAPSRAEVDPRGLSGILRHCFILERIAPGMARFRVAGQELCDRMGMEMKGLPFSSMFLPEARDQLESVLERVFAAPETARLTVRSPGGFRRSQVDGQLLLLPLRSDLGAITRVMGAIAMDSLDGRKPRRLDIVAAEQRVIPKGRSFGARPDEGARPAGAPGEVVELRFPPGG